MNKHIKKSLIIYISLTLLLVGMASVSYAITATNSDNYVTRSRYAIDMAHLMSRLEEKETNLIDTINKYRATDIKFTTFDTPDIQMTSGGAVVATRGYYTGGNLFPRSPVNDTWYYGYGLGSSMQDRIEGYRAYISMFRLWNGNYYITNDISLKTTVSSSDAGMLNHPIHRYAVPVENYPGWYLVIGIYGIASARNQSFFSLVKLDPQVPMPTTAILNQMMNGEIQVRFKKDLFTYLIAAKKLTTSPVVTDVNMSYYAHNNIGYLFSSLPNWFSYDGSKTIRVKSWLDENTGDYMMTLSGIRPSARAMDASIGAHVYTTSSNDVTLSYVIPKDNVEYLMGPMYYMDQAQSGVAYSGTTAVSWPDPRDIGSGLHDDPYFDIEIVDGVNGIKYWHTYKKPTDQKLGENYTDILGFNYSLPIVY